MTKSELIKEVKQVVSTNNEAQAALECVLNNIIVALKSGEAVAIAGFGTFKVSKRNARKGRNPKTGETINIRAKNIAKFIPGKALKEIVM